MNIHLIAQATQPSVWTPEGVALVLGALVTVIGAVVAGVIAIIKANKSDAKADAAQNTANQAVVHAQSLDRSMTTLALNTPTPAYHTPGERPLTPPSPLLLIPLLILPFFLGCALFSTKSASEDKVAALEQTFASTVTALTQLRHDGKLSDTDWARTKEIAEGIDAAFDALHDDLDAGRKVDVDVVLNGIRASLQRLSTYRSEATRAVSDASAPARSSGLARNLGQERVQRRAA